jgi:putative ABC transport system permease protein
LEFALPPMMSLGRVSTLRVLRRDLGVPGGAGIFGMRSDSALICAMVLWQAQDLRLGAYVLGGVSCRAAGVSSTGRACGVASVVPRAR